MRHPYDESLTGLEDLAFSSWLMEEGYTIAYVAEAEVIHLHQETLLQVKRRYQREAIAMKQILPKSKFSFKNFIWMWLRTSLSDLNQARHDRILIKHFFKIIIFRMMQYWGTFQGFHYAGKIDQSLHRAFYYPPHILDKKTPKKRVIEQIDYENNGDMN
jgi:cellulose synthase/poly-beta-1,6-N-acetylglucosamine synthase-like glycosyltransferase